MWNLAMILMLSAEVLPAADIIVVLEVFLGDLCVRSASVQQISQISALDLHAIAWSICYANSTRWEKKALSINQVSLLRRFNEVFVLWPPHKSLENRIYDFSHPT